MRIQRLRHGICVDRFVWGMGDRDRSTLGLVLDQGRTIPVPATGLAAQARILSDRELFANEIILQISDLGADRGGGDIASDNQIDG